MLDMPEHWWQIALRLLVALLLGGVLGWEREVQRRPAGLRTYMMVSLGACAFTILGIGMTEAAAESGDALKIDPTRLVQGMMGALGFLGAGAIIESRGQVRGLTTAAGLWVSAAIGLASAVGRFDIAGMVAAFGLLVLLALRPFKAKIEEHSDAEGDDKGDTER